MVTLDEGSALIRLLGPVEAVRDGTVLALGGPRQRALLALLAVAGPQGLSAGAIADELWGGDPPEGYRTTVRSYVSRLRRALGDVIDTAPGSAYRLRLPPEAVDAHAFEGLLRRADEALAAGAPARGRDLLGRALGLWRGAPLADVGGHGRLRAESARLEDLRLHAIERRLEADIALGRGDQVVEELEALVGAHPFRERLWGHLMLALYHADRQAEALEAYQRARRTLLEELGIEPSAYLDDLETAVLRHEVPRVGPAGPRVRLPAAVTSFVGREAQLVEVEALLGEQRWVTLTGVGGVGKTRVALELARRHVAAFTGGVFFCDLAAVSDPDHVPATVAAAVGVDEGAAEPVAAMLALLADAEALVVLDNAEHVRAVCGELVGTLLRGCAHVRVLATSRAPLGAIGEVDYPLPPLTLPGEAPESAESVELFLTRARSANPRLADDQTTLAAVARICVELDGIPLALELAAARAKMLSLTEIAENLTDRFRFLVSWRRLSPARHQTLREAMDWSFTLLSPQERQGCARLSVFPAGFVLGSAAALWGGDRATALDVIARLGDASLVTADMRSTSTQYRMLETVRQYAAEQLEESGEAEEVRRAHALEVLVFAEQTYEQQLEHLDEWAADMGRRQPDLRAALSWSSTHDAEITARLLQRLWQFWWVRGQLTEGREWIRGALEHADEVGPALTAAMLEGAAGLAWAQGDFDEARECATAGLPLAEQAEDARMQGGMLTILGHVALGHDHDYAAAEDYFGRALRVNLEHDPRGGAAVATHNLASVAFAVGDVRLAEERYLDAQAQYDAAGDTYGVALSDLYLGMTLTRAGRLDEGARRAARALPVFVDMQFWQYAAQCVDVTAAVCVARGDCATAAVLWAAADGLRAGTGPGPSVIGRGRAEEIDRCRQGLGEALFATHWSEGTGLDRDEVFARALAALDG